MIQYLIAIPTFVVFIMLLLANEVSNIADTKNTMHDEQYVSVAAVAAVAVQDEHAKRLEARKNHHYSLVTKTYRVSGDVVDKVLHYAYRYEKKSFPKAEDILAVIGIESSWNPNAVSNLKSDPAVGLTQIRPGVWAKLVGSPEELVDIEKQVKYAAEILHTYYKETKNADDAIIAYNAGIGAWSKGRYTLKYLTKFQAERDIYRRKSA